MMDEFVFDLDKALDELEENEDKEQQHGGHSKGASLDDTDGITGTSSGFLPPSTMALDYTDGSCDNHNNLNGIQPSTDSAHAGQTLEGRLGGNPDDACQTTIKLDMSEADFAPSRSLTAMNSSDSIQQVTDVQNGLDSSHDSLVAESNEASETTSSETVNVPVEKGQTSQSSPRRSSNGCVVGESETSASGATADQDQSHCDEESPSMMSQTTGSKLSHAGSSLDRTVTDNELDSSTDHMRSVQNGVLEHDSRDRVVNDGTTSGVVQDAEGTPEHQPLSYSDQHQTSDTLHEEPSEPAAVETDLPVTRVDSSTAVRCPSDADKPQVSNPVTAEAGDPSASSKQNDNKTIEGSVIAKLPQDDRVSAGGQETTATSKDIHTEDVTDGGMTSKIVGFGDISDIDVSNDELEQYLSTIGGPDNCTEYDSKPVFMEEVCVSQDNASYGLAAPFSSSAVEGEDSTSEQEVKVSDERRGSSGSIEKFLAPVVMSPGITTPIEDPGYSKVPGYVPELSVTMEEESEDLDTSHAEQDKVHHKVSEDVSSNSEDMQSTSLVSNLCKESNSQSDGTNQSIIRTSKCSVEMGGARPKEPMATSGRISRPSSLLGLSTPDLPQSSAAASRLKPLSGIEKTTVLPQLGMQFSDSMVRDSGIVADSAEIDSGTSSPKDESFSARNINDLINTQLVAQNSLPLNQKQLDFEIKQRSEGDSLPAANVSSNDIADKLHVGMVSVQGVSEQPKCADAGFEAMDYTLTPGEQQPGINHLMAPTGTPDLQRTSPKQKRPSSLNIVSRSEKPVDAGLTPAEADVSCLTGAADSTTATPSSGGAHDLTQDGVLQGQPTNSELHPGSLTETTATEPVVPSPPTSANINLAITQLGKVAPVWVPDAEAPACMQCEAKFTFTKRRHHCRACGKVFCNSCCNLRSKLAYMDNKEARVCSKCYQDLIRAQVYERRHQQGQSPNPNNPSEYCSTVPPLQQAAGALNAPPPTVMVPSGVLRKDGNQRRAEGPKQVMFSDGIRPGGDLTELDGLSDQRPPIQRQTRKVYHVDKTDTSPHHRTRNEQGKPICLIPEQGLPPVLLSTGIKGDFSIEENPDPEKILPKIRSTEDPEPVVFAINKNLFVLVKIVTLDCCVNRVCWCFSTKGMSTVGQDDIVIVLECLPDEKTIPRDIFCHMGTVYEEASKGNTVSHLGHTIFAQEFLDSRDHSGFLYINASYQCLQKLILPQPPFIFGILLQRWETPWAKVFPIRLMLRLGAEYRYYPCPLISVRFRKPVFGEIGHTIMNLLADFRNYQYMLPQVPGVTIHMGDKETFINFPRNRYNNIMKVLTNSNDHVMALAANFSLKADSHLVCLQNEDGRYLTQAINIQNKPRKVTGASFVVFNGAFKQAGGVRAKSSIVEDGLMVQITAKMMADLKEAMKSMMDYVIECGGLSSPEPEETITVKWVEDDSYVNIGIKSPIDNMPMDGIESIRIHTSTDFAGDKRMIRWTECFFVQTPTDGNSRDDPVDLSRLAESLANAICIALAPHLDKLQSEHLTKIGLRATIDPDKTCYEVGSSGTRLPDEYMDVLDSALIPVIHNAATHNQDGPVILELIFHIIE